MVSHITESAFTIQSHCQLCSKEGKRAEHRCGVNEFSVLSVAFSDHCFTTKVGLKCLVRTSEKSAATPSNCFECTDNVISGPFQKNYRC